MMGIMEDLDRRIIELINERVRRYVDEMKRRGEGAADAFSPMDRVRVYEQIANYNGGPIASDALRKIYTEIISNALVQARPTRVAYLGPEGTFTQIALLEVFGESVEAIPQKTIPDVFLEVEMDKAPFGIVPVENSTEGAVTYTLDELLDTDLKIVCEKFLRISYCLVSLCPDIRGVKKLYVHPQAAAQCKSWIRKNLPGAEMHNVASNSLAAETASWDKNSAAISSEISARIYSLNVLDRNIEDSKNNYTRFLVLGKKDNPPTGNDKTSIVCAVKDKPGALYDLLRAFHEAGINMTKIESRPDKKSMWEYNFFIDFNGHTNDTVVRAAVDIMKQETLFFKILGSYPAAN
ncbi:MAG TPA: prephenate dehydratase [Spirochaetota bacterium]|nr:prephenate dehydratase [Spirochaetota bacterium]